MHMLLYAKTEQPIVLLRKQPKLLRL